MAVSERLISADEFFDLASLPENEDKRLELEDGVVIEMASSTRINTVTGSRINYFISAFVLPNNLGYVTGADGGFRLSPTRARRPDVGFVSAKHGVELVGVEFDIAPDLAVEVVSEDEDIFRKAREYLRAGTQLVWAVYADEQTVYVMRLDEDGAIISTPFDINATLDGGAVLPGFRLAVRDIFP